MKNVIQAEIVLTVLKGILRSHFHTLSHRIQDDVSKGVRHATIFGNLK